MRSVKSCERARRRLRSVSLAGRTQQRVLFRRQPRHGCLRGGRGDPVFVAGFERVDTEDDKWLKYVQSHTVDAR